MRRSRAAVRTRTSPPHATGRRIFTARFVDGFMAIGLVGADDTGPGEVFGPISSDEAVTLAAELLVGGEAEGADESSQRAAALSRAFTSLTALEDARGRGDACTAGAAANELRAALGVLAGTI